MKPTASRSRPAPLSRSVRFLAGALLWAWAAAVTAAPCDLDWDSIREDYRLGRFEEVIDALAPCADSAPSRDERREAYLLLAKSHLVQDDVEAAQSAIQRLLIVSPAFEPLPNDSLRFRKAVAAQRRSETGVTISSVSKSNESLREAPATVIVITAKQMARRGYIDLEDVLHDLPGFDISHGSGGRYSNFYQRGYRTGSNDRTLFLIDGVEESDLWSNAVYLSRQYPLSNIDRIEVIYGPASTMYGPNAFVGVINILTKEPDALIEDGKLHAVSGTIAAGTWNTRYLDATYAGRSKSGNVAYMATSRVYESDEADRSGFEDWDFDPGFYDAQFEAGAYDELFSSPELAALALERDKAAFDQTIEGQPIRYTNPTDDWSITAKLRIFNVTLGLQKWRREEGNNGWYVDTRRSASESGNQWIPEHTSLYLKYSGQLGPVLGFQLFTQYLKHEVDPGSRNTQIRNYLRGDLTQEDLLAGIESFWVTTRFAQSSSQLRTEFKLIWEPSEKLVVVGGIEARDSSLQGNYLLNVEPATGNLTAERRTDFTSFDTESEVLDQLDLGVYAQASYRPDDDWKVVLGARVDRNEVSALTGRILVTEPCPEPAPAGCTQLREFSPSGYGTVFNPRLAVVHTPGNWVFKAIYAEAFKDASNFNRYATNPGQRDLPNPDLSPETVSNIELGASWQPRETLSLDLAAYSADYSSAVVSRRVVFGNGFTDQNQALGSLDISGLQANLEWRRGRFELLANYTYADPKSNVPAEDVSDDDDPEEAETEDESDDASGQRVGDIAEHRINALFNFELSSRVNANLRLNYVGDRRTGDGTSVIGNPFQSIDSYLVAHAALSWKLGSGFTLRAVVDNLTDEFYYHPGVRSARGQLAARLPQPERSVFFGLSYER